MQDELIQDEKPFQQLIETCVSLFINSNVFSVRNLLSGEFTALELSGLFGAFDSLSCPPGTETTHLSPMAWLFSDWPDQLLQLLLFLSEKKCCIISLGSKFTPPKPLTHRGLGWPPDFMEEVPKGACEHLFSPVVASALFRERDQMLWSTRTGL